MTDLLQFSTVSLSFVNFVLHPNPQKKSNLRSVDTNSSISVKHSEIDACSYELFPHNNRYYQLLQY